MLRSLAALVCVFVLPGALLNPLPAVAEESDGYVPMTPTRFLDTRTTTGGHLGPLMAGDSLQVSIGGVHGVPDDATAVSLNLTAVDPPSGGYLTVYPSGTNVPTASNVNFYRGHTIANHVVTGLGSDGRVTINSSGAVDVIVDVVGYFGSSSGFVPMTPHRLLDTRTAVGVVTTSPVAQGTTVDLTVAGGATGVPANATAVALNLTSTQSSSDGWVTAYPAGTPRPTASNLNYRREHNTAGLAIVRVGDGRKISLFTSRASHLIADVQGYFLPGSEYIALDPDRLVDTRFGTGAPPAKILAGRTLTFAVTGRSGVPTADVSAVFLNVTAVNSESAGYGTVFPFGGSRPLASTVNFRAGETLANSTLARVGYDGKVSVQVMATSDVIVDIAGYVQGDQRPPTESPTAGDDAIDNVVMISVDGLASRAITALGPSGTPHLHRLFREGSGTLNTRTAVEQTVTLPNHTGMLTGRSIDGPDGHHYRANSDQGGTVHSVAGHYVASAFDVVHDHGGPTALWTSKVKFAVFDRTWDSTNGAPDSIAGDDGRDKIDHYRAASERTLVSEWIPTLDDQPTLEFFHFAMADAAGHAHGWMSERYLAAVRAADNEVGRILSAIDSRPAVKARTAVILTADHGGDGKHHDDTSNPKNYTIPFVVWGPDVAAGADLYVLNPTSRHDPQAKHPGYANPGPIRNAELGNVALDLLDLPGIPGSMLNRTGDLVVFE